MCFDLLAVALIVLVAEIVLLTMFFGAQSRRNSEIERNEEAYEVDDD